MFNLPELANSWMCEFVENGNTFHSADHYIMYRKALLFGDTDTATAILNTTESDCTMWRVLGRRITGFDSTTWRNAAPGIGEEAYTLKFSQNQALLDILISTGDSILVCNNFYDRYWGAGIINDSMLDQPSTWLGLNWSGDALMVVRSQLAV